MKKVMIVIPTYNEKESLPKLIAAIRQIFPNIYLTIVDDNSPDGTGALADQMAVTDKQLHVIHRPAKQGLGSAYRQGFAYALGQKMDIVCQMDADMSHDPRYLLDMLRVIEKYDVVLGSRYLRGVRVDNWAFRRLLLSKFANIYVQFVAPLPFEDITSGYKCFRREVLEAINLNKVRSEGYCFQIEMTYHAHRKGFKVAEIPITFYERQGGYSKMSRHIIWEALWLVVKIRLGLV
ncbi:MAG: polyprenol monophosphomannose synthase [Candidatus Schekmanbacteria bacterium]|nr:polyprenol monophosphomannose synthase [Candidatus Schekmanbacteria bacterium]